MKRLLSIAHSIDWFNQTLGACATWLTLLACLVSAANATMRYAFDMSSNAWLEVQWYMFNGMVMLGASYTLKLNEHVRVDILYTRLSSINKARLDLVGMIVFLMPMVIVVGWFSWAFFRDSFAIQETSNNPGGLVRWPVKFLLPFGFLMLGLQGVSEIIKRVAYLRNEYDMDTHYERPLQ